MPSPRTTHGITLFEYSTDNSTWVSVGKLEANGSEYRPGENNGEAKHYTGGNYGYPAMDEYDIVFMDRTIFDTIAALHLADTFIYHRWTFDNDELHTTTVAQPPAQALPLPVSGVMDGRSDKYRYMVSIPSDLVTKTIA